MGCPTRFKWLGRCFLCTGKDNLSIVSQYGYETLHYHYHPECVRRVLANPDQYPRFVDTAIAIMDRINEKLESETRSAEHRRRGLERAWNTMRTLDDIMTSRTDGQNRAGSPINYPATTHGE